MLERIIAQPDKVYKPRIQVQYATLYKLLNHCRENQLRFGQALSNALDNVDLYYVEDADLDSRIQEFIAKP